MGKKRVVFSDVPFLCINRCISYQICSKKGLTFLFCPIISLRKPDSDGTSSAVTFIIFFDSIFEIHLDEGENWYDVPCTRSSKYTVNSLGAIVNM